jgi:hypothetical protein
MPNGVWTYVSARISLALRSIPNHGSHPYIGVRNQGGTPMTSTLANRRVLAAVAAGVLALGVGAPAAGASPVDLTSDSDASAGSTQIQPGTPVSTNRNTGGDISDWGVVAIGTGAASLALISIGGTRAASRRRHQQQTARQSVAA